MTSVCEYIWLDHSNNFRSKTKIMHNHDPNNGFPMWNYDGSSTGQADGSTSEVFIRPVKVVNDPFRSNHRALFFLVLCDTWLFDKENTNNDKIAYKPHPDNTRYQASITFNEPLIISEEPWFGMEQEFFFMKNGVPLGMVPNPNSEVALGMFPNGKNTTDLVSVSGKPQGSYYCGVGPNNVYGRDIAEHTLNNIIATNDICCTGLNYEVAPGQCEFQIFGNGIDVADSLLLFRYILQRTAEIYDTDIQFHPKPVNGDWNGSGCHTNYSTDSTRKENGIETIKNYIALLKTNHKKHIKVYGVDNKKRLTGKHETASWDKFSHGVADRGASIRVPTKTFVEKSGYIEDRRPSSNCDPYLVITKLVETTILKGKVVKKNTPVSSNN